MDLGQIHALLEILREPCRTMALLGIRTGLRIAEILGLRWRNVDLIARQLNVTQAVYRGTVNTLKNKGSRRLLSSPRPVVQALPLLRPEPGHGTDETLVFRSRKGTPTGIPTSSTVI